MITCHFHKDKLQKLESCVFWKFLLVQIQIEM
jgi:hypothetical protein